MYPHLAARQYDAQRRGDTACLYPWGSRFASHFQRKSLGARFDITGLHKRAGNHDNGVRIGRSAGNGRPATSHLASIITRSLSMIVVMKQRCDDVDVENVLTFLEN